MTFMSHEPTSRAWVSHQEFAEHLGIHTQTLHRLRRNLAFKEGVHYRRTGLTTAGPLQYNLEKAEAAFTAFRRQPAAEVECFSRVPNPVSR